MIKWKCSISCIDYIKLNNFFLYINLFRKCSNACRLYNNEIIHESQYLPQAKHMCLAMWLHAYLVTINWLLKIINCLKLNLKIYNEIYLIKWMVLSHHIKVGVTVRFSGILDYPISYVLISYTDDLLGYIYSYIE